MENNEIMNSNTTNEVTDLTTVCEETVSVSNDSLKKVAVIGGAMIVGGLAAKFIVKPAVNKFKTWRENRKMAKQFEEDVFDGEAKEVEPDEDEA
jgi:hypothetical protein